jgi:hypothetical protein
MKISQRRGLKMLKLSWCPRPSPSVLYLGFDNGYDDGELLSLSFLSFIFRISSDKLAHCYESQFYLLLDCFSHILVNLVYLYLCNAIPCLF